VSDVKAVIMVFVFLSIALTGCVGTTAQDGSDGVTAKTADELLPAKAEMPGWTFSETEGLSYGHYPGFDSGRLTRIIRGNDTDSVVLIKISKWNGTDSAENVYGENLGKIKKYGYTAIDTTGLVSKCFGFIDNIVRLSGIICVNRGVMFELTALDKRQDTLVEVAKIIESKI
jgi:hypothetical protein